MRQLKNKNLHKKGVIGEVYGSVNAFVKDAEQFGDVTMLCMEYHGNLKQTVAD